MNQKLFAALLLSAVCASNAATALTYNCKIKEFGNMGWIPSFVMFEVEEGENTVRTLDPITKYSLGGAVEAKIIVDTDKRLTFKWRTDSLPSDTNQSVTLDYKATYLRSKNLLLLRAFPRGFNNDFSGRGPCTLTNKRIE